MIKRLAEKDQSAIIDFCYKREKENLFVLGSFKNYKKPFSSNKYYGYYKNKKLIGLGVFFQKFKNFVINTNNQKIINEIVDFAMKDSIKIKCIANFKKYADPAIERLIENYDIRPKKVSQETVYILTKKDFQDFSEGDEEIATKNDIDELVWFNTGKKGKDIADEERKKIIPHQEFILRKNNKIVSKANIHGISKNYFQIGGVGTRKEHRRKGYAKKVISSLCKHFFEQGVKYAILFTANDNIPAQKLYKKLGFKPIDKFVIADF